MCLFGCDWVCWCEYCFEVVDDVIEVSIDWVFLLGVLINLVSLIVMGFVWLCVEILVIDFM